MIPPMTRGCHAYLTDVAHDPTDHLVHQVKEIALEMVHMTCGRMAIRFESPLKRYPRVIPTTDALTCMLCIAEEIP